VVTHSKRELQSGHKTFGLYFRFFFRHNSQTIVDLEFWSHSGTSVPLFPFRCCSLYVLLLGPALISATRMHEACTTSALIRPIKREGESDKPKSLPIYLFANISYRYCCAFTVFRMDFIVPSTSWEWKWD